MFGILLRRTTHSILGELDMSKGVVISVRSHSSEKAQQLGASMKSAGSNFGIFRTASALEAAVKQARGVFLNYFDDRGNPIASYDDAILRLPGNSDTGDESE